MPNLNEIEIKLKIPSEEDAMKLIEKLGKISNNAPEYFEQTDIYYDAKNGDLMKKDFVIRMRIVNGKGYVAMKSPRIFINDAVQKRIELEFEVKDIEAIKQKIKNQGLLETTVMEKRRTEFVLDNAVIAVDELPFIGWFLEIESDGEESIEKIIKDLGVSSFERVKLNYGELMDKKMSEINLPMRPNLKATFEQEKNWKSKQN